MENDNSKEALNKEKIRKENILRIGVCNLIELEEKVKAYRNLNQTSKKKRYVVAREPIYTEDRKLIIDKAEDIDISKTLLLKRYFRPDHEFKTFSPDEGLVIVSDMSSANGIQLSLDLVTQIMNLGGGAYEAFIDRVDNVSQLITLFGKGLFPKLVIVGYLEENNANIEVLKLNKIKQVDPHLRIVEVTHSEIKPDPFLPKVRQIPIVVGDSKAWQRFVYEIISEYTRPYFSEQLN